MVRAEKFDGDSWPAHSCEMIIQWYIVFEKTLGMIQYCFVPSWVALRGV
jgi:hypothetical protein